MAVEKKLVRQALENKFKGKSLSKTSKDKRAEAYAPVIDNPADIDDYINAQTPAIEILIAETDSRVTEALKKKAPETKPANTETSTEDEIELPADTPEYVKVMHKQNQAMMKKLEGFEAKQSQQTVEQLFKSHEDLKGIPEIFLKGRTPQTAEDIDTAVAEIKADVEAYQTANNVTIIGKDTPPGAGGGAGGSTPKAEEVAPELQAYFAKANNS